MLIFRFNMIFRVIISLLMMVHIWIHCNMWLSTIA